MCCLGHRAGPWAHGVAVSTEGFDEGVTVPVRVLLDVWKVFELSFELRFEFLLEMEKAGQR